MRRWSKWLWQFCSVLGLVGLMIVGAFGMFRSQKPIAAISENDSSVAPATVADRVGQYGEQARARWRPMFEAAGVAYPPREVVLVGLKLEKRLLIHAGDGTRRPALVRAMSILAASGTLGPKLREGDRQVPEGLYRIDWLNPNSRHVLSMHINYPNEQDMQQARAEGRDQPGCDIMIHGGCTSIGCLAIGDEPSIDLFILAADTGIDNIRVILSPVDFRVRGLPPDRPPAPAWTVPLYEQIASELRRLPRFSTEPAKPGM